MLVDYDHRRITFPPEIIITTARPDIIIWSMSIKKIFLFELTVPLEENFGDASSRKTTRYHELCDDINSSTCWRASHFPFEVGARGFVARSTRGLLKKLGIPNHLRSSIIKSLSSIAAKSSFIILRSHNSFEWDRKRPLLQLKEEVEEQGAMNASPLESLNGDP